jgi:hypothetical protein
VEAENGRNSGSEEQPLSRPIKVAFRPISAPLQDLINEHNHRVERVWMLRGSNCKPFTPSTVPAAGHDLSRVRLAAEHSGLIHERRS